MASIARRREPTAARQVQPRQDQRMPNGPRTATNIAPRFNNNAGSQAIGRRRNTPENWRDRGFESRDAQQSVTRQYGLVKGEDGQWGKPDMAFLTRQMEANGWGPEFQRNSLNEQGTPINIGGARWYSGKNGVDFSGQASDLAGGTAFNANKQVAYNPGGGNVPRRNPRGQNSPGGMPNQGGGENQGGGGGGGGGNNRGSNGGRSGGQRRGYPGVGTAGGLGEYANFPAPQSPAENFLPMTPQFEAGRRGLADEQMAQQTDILAQQALVDPLYQQQKARLETDRDYDVERMKEQLAGRGVFTPYGAGGQRAGSVMNDPLSTGGGIGEYLGRRDIQIPYGRQFSDLGTNAFNQYGGLNNQYGDTELAYNQGMAELLLGRAADAAEMMPMNVPQYSNGNRILRGQGYNNRPNKPNKNRGRRNRGRNR